MKKRDIFFITGVILFFLPFFLSSDILGFYKEFNKNHGMIMSFIKFGLLATLGEVIGLRIRAGKYNAPRFGIIPRAIVWGFLGLGIKLAFIVFATGIPNFLAYLGLDIQAGLMKGPFSLTKLLASFSISVSMNLIFAPILMTVHKITDEHITINGGTIRGLFTPIRFGEILEGLNWEIMWKFVFKKTIPIFWIPAHTITFLLPPQVQILFAALLGIVLGIILAIASIMAKEAK